MSIELRLSELGITLPPAPRPVASYVPFARTGNLVIISGQLPMRDGKLIATGKVPSQVTLEQGQQAAAQCAINALAVLKDALDGRWENLARIVRIGAFVMCDEGYGDIPKVANGASDLLVNVLGDIGKHARAAVGTYMLPLGASVEVELMAEVRG